MGQRRVIHGNRRTPFGVGEASTRWSPLQLPLLQGLWLAEQGVSAAPVQTWANQSVVDAARNFTQPTALYRPPTVTPNDPNFGTNNTSVSTTPGSDQRMVTGTFTSPDVGAATMFCVARFNAPVSYVYCMQANPGSATGQTAQIRLAPIGGGNYGMQVQNGVDTPANYFIDLKDRTLGIIVVYSTSAYKLYINSPTIVRATGVNTQIYLQPVKLAALGFEPIGSYGGCTMGMMGLMAGEMSVADMTKLYDYWSVTRGYPLATLP